MGTKYVYGDIPYQIMWQSITLMKKIKTKVPESKQKGGEASDNKQTERFCSLLKKKQQLNANAHINALEGGKENELCKT